MNKVEKLIKDIDDYSEKKRKQIEKIQNKCKHEKTKRWSDYSGINEQCEICSKYLR